MFVCCYSTIKLLTKLFYIFIFISLVKIIFIYFYFILFKCSILHKRKTLFCSTLPLVSSTLTFRLLKVMFPKMGAGVSWFLIFDTPGCVAPRSKNLQMFFQFGISELVLSEPSQFRIFISYTYFLLSILKYPHTPCNSRHRCH